MTIAVTVRFAGIRRGDYITMSGMPQYAETTSGLARGKDAAAKRARVMHATATTIDVRDQHPNRIREWLRARWEDCVLWPLADIGSHTAPI